MQRALDWMLSMQCKNGGWASFDKDNDRMVFQHIPFADHNAMLDPPTVDITGRVLECLASYGYSLKDEPVRRAVEFIKREQEPDGSWFGRWGVNYIYGTMLVLRGLEAVGVDYHEPCVQQAVEWLRMMQNPDGGWGETCDSYDDPNTKGVGPSTASQTAWAVMGLLAANDTRSDSLQRGIAYLLKTQRRDGSWDESLYTGTGFPRVFYLMYYMYRQYFPLLALTTYAKASAAAAEDQLPSSQSACRLSDQLSNEPSGTKQRRRLSAAISSHMPRSCATSTHDEALLMVSRALVAKAGSFDGRAVAFGGCSITLSLINDWTVGAACRLITKRRFPPMRYISRTGCNDVLSPYFFYLTHGVNFWLYAFAQGWANLNSRIVDIGSGCGKSAVDAARFRVYGTTVSKGSISGSMWTRT